MRRFRLGVTLAVLGLVLTLVEGLYWIWDGGLRFGLQTLLGIAVTLYGVRLLRQKRGL
ncbi:hypothetical protein [Deinococcus sp. UYEF24]